MVKEKRKTLHLVQLTAVLAKTEFRLRYTGSVLGYVWALCKPLMVFTVLYLVFSKALRFGEGIERFPLMLLFSIVLWYFFVEATGSAVRVLVANADILRKVSFPHVVLPISTGLISVINLGLNLLVMLGIFVVVQVPVTLNWLFIPLLLIEFYIFTLGITLALASLYVRFRDVGQIWEVVSQTLFYATPIIYPLSMVPDEYHAIILASPLGQIIHMSRELMLSSNPDLSVLAGPFIAVPLSIAAVTFGIGLLLYRTVAPSVVEDL